MPAARNHSFSTARPWAARAPRANHEPQLNSSCLATPVRILEINSGREVNGALVHTYLLVQQLIALGHEVTVLCRRGFWLWDKLDGLPVERIHSLMERRVGEIRRVAAIVRQRRIDVLHTHMSRAHMFGILLRTLTGVPCVATAHNRHFQLHWKWNDYVIANSDATRQFQIRVNRVPADRIRTVYCFSDLSRFQTIRPETRLATRREMGIVDDRPLLGVVGEVVKRKGHVYLFQALPQIAEAFPQFQLAILGRSKREEPDTRRLRQLLVKYKLFRKVIWLGRRNNVPDFMAAMDVCVVPSLEEPLGLVAMEAQAAGTPVVVSDAGGLVEIVDHQVNGLVVPAANSTALAEAIIQLLRDAELRQQLTANGRRDVFSRFGPEVLTRQVVGVLQQATRRKAA